jgi:small subunit ribosomal protein S4
MARNLDPKCKLCRREGLKLFLKGEKCFSPKCPMVKRNYPPGVHGPTSNNKRTSTYGKQLREKQKAKRLYHLMENQFRNYYTKAINSTGNTSENLLRLLETRLDNIIYRLGFVPAREIARQMITHGHFNINGKRVSIPSYQPKVGDLITLNEKAKDKTYWKNRMAQTNNAEVTGWLSFNPSTFTGQIVALPKKDDLPVPFDPTLIIEFYSR